jgi:hypothetical protein
MFNKFMESRKCLGTSMIQQVAKVQGLLGTRGALSTCSTGVCSTTFRNIAARSVLIEIARGTCDCACVGRP